MRLPARAALRPIEPRPRLEIANDQVGCNIGKFVRILVGEPLDVALEVDRGFH